MYSNKIPTVQPIILIFIHNARVCEDVLIEIVINLRFGSFCCMQNVRGLLQYLLLNPACSDKEISV